MASDFGGSLAIGLIQGAVIGGGLYGLAKLSQWMTKRKTDKWRAENKHLSQDDLQLASDRRELEKNKRDFIIWVVVIAIVVFGFWLLMSMAKK